MYPKIDGGPPSPLRPGAGAPSPTAKSSGCDITDLSLHVRRIPSSGALTQLGPLDEASIARLHEQWQEPLLARRGPLAPYRPPGPAYEPPREQAAIPAGALDPGGPGAESPTLRESLIGAPENDDHRFRVILAEAMAGFGPSADPAWLESAFVGKPSTNSPDLVTSLMWSALRSPADVSAFVEAVAEHPALREEAKFRVLGSVMEGRPPLLKRLCMAFPNLNDALAPKVTAYVRAIFDSKSLQESTKRALAIGAQGLDEAPSRSLEDEAVQAKNHRLRGAVLEGRCLARTDRIVGLGAAVLKDLPKLAAHEQRWATPMRQRIEAAMAVHSLLGREVRLKSAPAPLDEACALAHLQVVEVLSGAAGVVCTATHPIPFGDGSRIKLLPPDRESAAAGGPPRYIVPADMLEARPSGNIGSQVRKLFARGVS